MLHRMIAAVLLSLFALCSPSLALERFEIVTTAEMEELLNERQAGRIDFLLINTLDALIAEHHTIPGSVNIPWSKLKERAVELGQDKDRLIITYCMGYR